MNATNPSALTIADLDISHFDEPRILDTRLGEVLGMVRPTNIRQLIERNRDELSRYGEVCITVMQTSEKGGRPSNAYWLTEGQALCLSALSDAPNAPDARYMLIEVYMAYRRGQLPPSAPTTQPDPIAVMGQFVREVIEPAARLFGTDQAARVWNAPSSPLSPFPVSGTASAPPAAPTMTTAPRPESSAPRLNPGFRAWWGLVLRQGEFAPGEGWPVEISGEGLYGHYRTFTAGHGEIRLLSREGFGRSLGVVMPTCGFHREQKVRVEGVRRSGYHLPSLEACRSAFKDWIYEDDDTLFAIIRDMRREPRRS